MLEISSRRNGSSTSVSTFERASSSRETRESTMQQWQSTTWQLMRLALAGSMIAGATMGCSEGLLPVEASKSNPDTGISSPDGRSTPPDRSDRRDTGTTRADTGDPGPEGPRRPTRQLFTGCGASGVSSNGGVRAVQCYGPWDLSGREVRDRGVRWQPGGFRVLTPR